MEQIGNSNIYGELCQDATGKWQYKIEERVSRRADWFSAGFETRELAVESLNTVLKALGVKETWV